MYMATLDAHVVCLDRNTGEELWDIPITAPGEDGKEVGDICQKWPTVRPWLRWR